MKIVSKGSKTFIQTYNPTNIAVVEARKNNQIVYRFYPSANAMSATDRVSYCAACRLVKARHRAYGA